MATGQEKENAYPANEIKGTSFYGVTDSGQLEEQATSSFAVLGLANGELCPPGAFSQVARYFENTAEAAECMALGARRIYIGVPPTGNVTRISLTSKVQESEAFFWESTKGVLGVLRKGEIALLDEPAEVADLYFFSETSEIQYREVIEGETLRVEHLPLGLSLEGAVTQAGVPPEQVCNVTLASPTSRQWALSGQDGSFSFSVADDRTARVAVATCGQLVGASPVVPSGTTIQLDRGATIRLAVENELGGLPADTSVQVVGVWGERYLAEQVPSGHFVTGPVPSDASSVEVSATGYFTEILALDRSRKRADLGLVVLKRIPEIHGRVLALSGQPISDASIYRCSESRRGHSTTIQRNLDGRPKTELARTDERGSFRVELEDEQLTTCLEIWATSFLTQRVVPSPERLLNGEVVVVTLDAAPSLSGTVFDNSGQALPEVELWLTASNGRPNTVGPVFTDVDGRFSFENLEDRAFVLEVIKNGYEELWYELQPGPEVLELFMGVGDGSELQVLDAETDAPIVNAAVRRGLGNSSANNIGRGLWLDTNEDGRVRFKTVRRNGSVFQVSADGYISESVVLTPGSNSRVELLPERMLGLKVLVTSDSTTVENIVVRCRNQEDSSVVTTRTNSLGEAFFEELQVGSYTVDLNSKELFLDVPKTVTLTEPGTTVVLNGRRGTLLEGDIVGLSAEEVSTVRVSARFNRRRSGRVDALSYGYSVRGLSPGTWVVDASTESGMTASAVVDVQGDAAVVRQDLVFSEGITVSGLVLNSDGGVAVGSVELQPLGASGERIREILRTDGSFALEGTSPGSYYFRVLSGTSAGSTTEQVKHEEVLEVLSDTERFITLENRRISGRVSDASGGGSLTNVDVVVTTAGGRNATRCRSDSSGDFDCSSPDGDVVLTAEKSGFSPWVERIDAGPTRRLQIELWPEQTGTIRLETEVPLNSARFFVTEPQTGLYSDLGRVTVDRDGFANLPLPDRQVEVIARHGDLLGVGLADPLAETTSIRLSRRALASVFLSACVDGLQCAIALRDGNGRTPPWLQGRRWARSGLVSPVVLWPGNWTMTVFHDPSMGNEAQQRRFVVGSGQEISLVVE